MLSQVAIELAATPAITGIALLGSQALSERDPPEKALAGICWDGLGMLTISRWRFRLRGGGGGGR